MAQCPKLIRNPGVRDPLMETREEGGWASGRAPEAREWASQAQDISGGRDSSWGCQSAPSRKNQQVEPSGTAHLSPHCCAGSWGNRQHREKPRARCQSRCEADLGVALGQRHQRCEG